MHGFAAATLVEGPRCTSFDVGGEKSFSLIDRSLKALSSFIFRTDMLKSDPVQENVQLA